MSKRGALSCLLLIACNSGPIVTTEPDYTDYIPGVSDAPRTTEKNDSAPMRPQVVSGVITPTSGTSQPYVDGVPRTCWSDADCKGTFTHCVKDVPDEVGICTKECSSHSECTSNAMWSCGPGMWNETETKTMCMLTCVLNADCPTGTSCQNGYCGTPCSGNNCQAQQCSSHYGIDCVGDAVYWFNSCGDLEDLKETCAQGSVCVWGQCLSGTSGSGSGSGGSTGGSTGDSCGGTVYRCSSSSTVLELDGCGNIKGTQTCSSGKECSGGTCRCMPSSRTKCIGSTLWRLDSCNMPRTALRPC
jgi:hypothetical protein